MSGIQPFYIKDASEGLGSPAYTNLTAEQIGNIFNSYISNTKLSRLLDVDNLLDDAPIGSIFSKGADSLWTYSDPYSYTLEPAGYDILGGVAIGDGLNINQYGLLSVVPYSYELPTASSVTLGGIKIGSGLSIDINSILSTDIPHGSKSSFGIVSIGDNINVEDGVISVVFPNDYSLPIASNSILGGVKIGSTLQIDLNGILDVIFPNEYVLAIATADILGGVKIGQGLDISIDGIISLSEFSESDPVFTAWNKSDGISITESQISDLGEYLLVETDPIFIASPAFDITLGDISNWNSLVNYTHPTQSVISPTLTGANVLAGLIINSLGHVTSATSRALTLSDLGFIGDVDATKYIHPLSGITAGTYNSVIVDEYGHITDGSLLPYGDVFGPLSSTVNAVPRFDGISGTVLQDSGVTINDDNQLSFVSGKLIPQISAPVSPTGGEIYSNIDGNLYYYNSSSSSWIIIADSSAPKIVPITLPYASTVAGRCAGAVAGVNYPIGWTVEVSPDNDKDLLITHGLGRYIAHVTVLSVNGSQNRLLINNVAYSGIVCPTSNQVLIEGLATVAYSIIINCIFA